MSDYTRQTIKTEYRDKLKSLVELGVGRNMAHVTEVLVDRELTRLKKAKTPNLRTAKPPKSL